MNSPSKSLVASARREAILCGVVFLAAITYTITTCYRLGYRQPDPNVPLKFILGFPDWVFLGIIAPWGVCTVIAWFFSFVIMEDHDFGPAAGEERTASLPAGDRGHD